MIALTEKLPGMRGGPSAEYIRIKCLFDCYKEDKNTLFWLQDGGRALISLSDGDMTVYRRGGNAKELTDFVRMLSPRSVFSDLDTLAAIGFKNINKLNVMRRRADTAGVTAGDSLSSREIYDILNVSGFCLPEYQFFAVDFCRRLNRGAAEYFALKDRCAAVSFHTGKFALLCGIVSREKGLGTLALSAILQKNRGRELLACCGDSTAGFYEKNGFQKLYKAGYWCKNQT